MKYSLVLPCKDEKGTLAACISKAKKFKDIEIIVVDNNSRDGSARIAKDSGAKVFREKIQGYGAALKRGLSEAKGEYIIMCDADGTYDLDELPKLMKYATGRYDIVLGQRKHLARHSMSVMHRIGNHMLSGILRRFYNIPVKDSHSGFRMIKRTALAKMHLQTDGMDFASEMLMQAAILKMKVKEVPIHYYPRQGESKLRSIPDGWKHLRLMLLYSPNNLYLIPGISLIVLGIALLTAMMFGPYIIGGLTFQIHPMFIGSLMTIVGYQMLMLWLYTRIYIHNMFVDRFIARTLKRLRLEQGIAFGILLMLAGIAANAWILIQWIATNHGVLDIRWSIIGLTVIILGVQTFFGSFYLSMLGVSQKK